jgi:outer membrane protease
MKVAIVITLAMLISAGVSQAGVIANGLDLNVSLNSQKMDGHSTLFLTDAVWDPDNYTVIRISSELEFPLDVYMAGVEIAASGRLMNKMAWSIEFGISKTVNDPKGVVKDSDWLEFPTYEFDHKIQYTESDATIDGQSYDLRALIRLVDRPVFSLDGMIGYKHQDFSFDVIGITGWYLDLDFNQIPFEDYLGQQVGAYKVFYDMPYVAVGPRLNVTSTLNINAEFGFSPIVKARDEDDHILRYKFSEGKCDGTVFMIAGNTAYIINPSAQNWNISIGVGYQMTIIKTTGEQSQRWYGDDPATSGYDDTGDQISGIEYELKSKQMAGELKLICSF